METFPFSKYFDADRGRGLQTAADYDAIIAILSSNLYLSGKILRSAFKISPAEKSAPNSFYGLAYK